MLDKILKKHDKKSLILDYAEVLGHTNEEFSEVVRSQIGQAAFQKMRYGSEGKTSFLYLQTNNKWFSFAHNRKEKNVIFSRMDKKSWKYIIGYQEKTDEMS